MSGVAGMVKNIIVLFLSKRKSYLSFQTRNSEIQRLYQICNTLMAIKSYFELFITGLKVLKQRRVLILLNILTSSKFTLNQVVIEPAPACLKLGFDPLRPTKKDLLIVQ